MVSPLFTYSNRPFWYPTETELRDELQNCSFTFGTISSDLHNSDLVETVYKRLLRKKGASVQSPPPTPHSDDFRAHKRRKSDSGDLVAAKCSLAEDIHRLLASSVEAGCKETMRSRHAATVTTPVSATVPDITRRNSYRPWEDLPAPQTMFPILEMQTAKRKFNEDVDTEGDDDASALRQLSAVAAAQTAPEVTVVKQTERLDTPDDSSSTQGKAHRCPYYIRDKTGRTHSKCANRTFPNPRKLKEHVWQTTRPYKCSTCLFGFGRDKTRAIHVKERKKGCKPPPPGSALLRESYDNSPEHIRDQRIEAARSSEEIVEILNDFDKAKGSDSSSRDLHSYEDEEGSEVGSQEDDQKMSSRISEDFPQHSQIRLPSLRSATSPILQSPDFKFRASYAHSRSSSQTHIPSTPAHSRASSQTFFTNSPLSPQSPVHRVTLPPIQIPMNQPESWHNSRSSGIYAN